MGTSTDYFEHFRYADERRLRFSEGGPFAETLDAVLGAEVARKLGYRLGDELVVTHGIGTEGFGDHENHPFKVTGILAPTGTPVDRTVHVGLAGIEAMHINWNRVETDLRRARGQDLTPRQITAFLLGLDSRLAAFKLQRDINRYGAEPLLAIFPGVALQEPLGPDAHWRTGASGRLDPCGSRGAGGSAGGLTGGTQRTPPRNGRAALGGGRLSPRRGVAHHGISAADTARYRDRSKAMQSMALRALQPWIVERFGLVLPIGLPTAGEWPLLAGLMTAGLLAGLVPAWRCYRNSLADGLSTRL